MLVIERIYSIGGKGVKPWLDIVYRETYFKNINWERTEKKFDKIMK